MLESFVSTQKQSVQRAMQRKFRKFISYKRDFFELILTALRGLLKEQLRYEQVRWEPRDVSLPECSQVHRTGGPR